MRAVIHTGALVSLAQYGVVNTFHLLIFIAMTPVRL
jgi:hypothetical protein